MKKTVLVLAFLGLAFGMQLSAQTIAGRYFHATELNANDIQVDQVVLDLNGQTYTANWETALATGENEMVTPLQNLVVDEQDLTISFRMNGQNHTGTFVSDGSGGYSLMLDGQTLFSREDW